MSEQVQKVVYTGHLPLSEMTAPEVPWKVGDRVVDKLTGEAGLVVLTEDFDVEQNVGVIFDHAPDTIAWMGDEEVVREDV